MNRRGFLSTLFTTAGGILVTPSIVTHGLKLHPVLQLPVELKYKYGDVIFLHQFQSPPFEYLPTFQDFLNTLEK